MTILQDRRGDGRRRRLKANTNLNGQRKKQELADLLQPPEGFEILLAIALGKPKEKVVLEQMGPDGEPAIDGMKKASTMCRNVTWSPSFSFATGRNSLPCPEMTL